METKIKIEVLFPEFGNLYGDMGNINYLEKCIPNAEIVKTSIDDEPAFLNEKINLIYLGPLTERKQEIIIEKLQPYREKIEEEINKGTPFLFTGNAVEILGKSIENEDGTSIEGLGIFDFLTKRDMLNRFNCLVLGKYEDIKIVGFKSQFTKLYGNNEDNYFINCEMGIGFNNENSKEGIKKNNFIGTHIIGPILILNPLLTLKLMKTMGIEEPKLAFEKDVIEAYNIRLKKFEELKK